MFLGGVARREGELPTEYEVFRLRKNAVVTDLNKLILTTFESVSTLALVLVMLNQGRAIELTESWYIISYRTCGSTTPVVSDADSLLLLGLGITAALFFAAKMLLRVLAVFVQVRTLHHKLRPGRVQRYVLLVLGFALSLLDPWNGSALVEAQFAPLDGDEELAIHYNVAMQKLRGDWLLLLVESLPQFIIQAIYASVAANNAGLGLPPAWYVSLFTTLLQLVNQLHEVVYLQWTMPKIKQWVASTRTSMAGNSAAVVPFASTVMRRASAAVAEAGRHLADPAVSHHHHHHHARKAKE